MSVCFDGSLPPPVPQWSPQKPKTICNTYCGNSKTNGDRYNLDCACTNPGAFYVYSATGNNNQGGASTQLSNICQAYRKLTDETKKETFRNKYAIGGNIGGQGGATKAGQWYNITSNNKSVSLLAVDTNTPIHLAGEQYKYLFADAPNGPWNGDLNKIPPYTITQMTSPPDFN